jgi:hypothetical protein
LLSFHPGKNLQHGFVRVFRICQQSTPGPSEEEAVARLVVDSDHVGAPRTRRSTGRLAKNRRRVRRQDAPQAKETLPTERHPAGRPSNSIRSRGASSSGQAVHSSDHTSPPKPKHSRTVRHDDDVPVYIPVHSVSVARQQLRDAECVAQSFLPLERCWRSDPSPSVGALSTFFLAMHLLHVFPFFGTRCESTIQW